MLFGIELTSLIQAMGVLGVAIAIFAESGLLVGFFLPGDSLLFTAGLLVSQHVLPININVFAALMFLAAVTGDSVGYAFGRKVGPKIFKREDSILFHKDNVRRAQEFYIQYGPITLVLARFMPVIRTFAPIVAGVGKMDYKNFLIFNFTGAFIWAVGMTYLGYFAGSYLATQGIDIEKIILPLVFVIIIISFLPPLIHIFKDAENRKKFMKILKKRR